MKTRLCFMLAVMSTSCGPSSPPLSGGKPISYWTLESKDADSARRQKAVTKLGNAGPADAAVLPALLEALHDTAPSVRREAILALMKFGPGAKQAIPALKEMERKDADEQVRAFAAKALNKLLKDEGREVRG